MKRKLATLDQALAPISSGASLTLGGSLLRRPPNAAVRWLIRNRIHDLKVMTWAATTSVDMLAAAGALAHYEGIYAGLFSHGLAPNFRRAVEEGSIEVRDFSETAMVARLRAAAQGLPSLPIKTLFGSDVALKNPEQIREYQCPISGERLLAVEAASTEFTILHGYAGDEFGNVQWPLVRDSDDVDQMMAAASNRLIVTVETIVPHDRITRQPALTYIPGHLVEAIVEVPYGAHPAAVDGFYDEDERHLRAYIEASATREGAQDYLRQYVLELRDHEHYLDQIGGRAPLEQLRVAQEGTWE